MPQHHEGWRRLREGDTNRYLGATHITIFLGFPNSNTHLHRIRYMGYHSVSEIVLHWSFGNNLLYRRSLPRPCCVAPAKSGRSLPCLTGDWIRFCGDAAGRRLKTSTTPSCCSIGLWDLDVYSDFPRNGSIRWLVLNSKLYGTCLLDRKSREGSIDRTVSRAHECCVWTTRSGGGGGGGQVGGGEWRRGKIKCSPGVNIYFELISDSILF